LTSSRPEYHRLRHLSEGQAVTTNQLTWRTDNINLAAYLLYLDHELLGIEWERGAGFFMFHKTRDLLHASVEFIGDEAQVNPKRYSMCFAELKNKLFDDHPNPPARRKKPTPT
jgi:hypothetical protein